MPEYRATCHLVVRAGKAQVHVWPDTPEHRKAGRTVGVNLTDKEAAAYGGDLIRAGSAGAGAAEKSTPSAAPAGARERDAQATRDKQETGGRTKSA